MDKNEQEWQKHDEQSRKQETRIDLILAAKFKPKWSLASSGLQPQNFRGARITS